MRPSVIHGVFRRASSWRSCAARTGTTRPRRGAGPAPNRPSQPSVSRFGADRGRVPPSSPPRTADSPARNRTFPLTHPSAVSEFPSDIRSGSLPLIIRSERAIAHVSGLSSCPNTSTRMFGLNSFRCASATASMPPGACRRVEHGANRTGTRQRFAVLGEQQAHHQPDDLTRRVMLTSGLVAHLGELPKEFLEDVAHRLGAHRVRVQVKVRAKSRGLGTGCPPCRGG